MGNGRGGGFVCVSRWGKRSRAGDLRLLCLFVVAAGGLVCSQRGFSQENVNPVVTNAVTAMGAVAGTDAPGGVSSSAVPDAPLESGAALDSGAAAESGAPPGTNATNTVVDPHTSAATGAVMTPQPVHRKQQVASDISVMTMFPYGDYRLFAATVRCYAWTMGVEYDRNSWGHVIGSRVDYIVEFIPVLLLNQPAQPNFWGGGTTPAQKWVPGISISPFGFRFLWRENKAIKPYVSTKLGAAVFTQKALSPEASYVNFNIQASFGVQVKVSENWDVRVDPFQFFHVSNGYLAASNPGMDELGMRFGVTYHLTKGNQVK